MRRIALLSTVAAFAVLAATASPAAAYHSCSLGGWANHGQWYITSLSVRHVSCRTGRRVALAFQRCRHRHGIRGRCHHRVLHYRCRETRGYGQGLFTGRVVCRRGARRVRHTYSQFT